MKSHFIMLYANSLEELVAQLNEYSNIIHWALINNNAYVGAVLQISDEG